MEPQESDLQHPIDPTRPTAKSAQPKTVLIVEDDEGIRETFRFALELENYTVFTAANGQIGFELLATIPKPCVILLDLMMPVMDGWGFVDVIGKDVSFVEIPIVVISAFADKAKTIRAQRVLEKPVDLNTLSQIVNQYCGSC
jgi:CheY-like chemotaxis protein